MNIVILFESREKKKAKRNVRLDKGVNGKLTGYPNMREKKRSAFVSGILCAEVRKKSKLVTGANSRMGQHLSLGEDR